MRADRLKEWVDPHTNEIFLSCPKCGTTLQTNVPTVEAAGLENWDVFIAQFRNEHNSGQCIQFPETIYGLTPPPVLPVQSNLNLHDRGEGEVVIRNPDRGPGQFYSHFKESQPPVVHIIDSSEPPKQGEGRDYFPPEVASEILKHWSWRGNHGQP